MAGELGTLICRLLLEWIADALCVALVACLAFVFLGHSRDHSNLPRFRYVKYILAILFLPFVIIHVFAGGRCHCGGNCSSCRWWES